MLSASSNGSAMAADMITAQRMEVLARRRRPRSWRWFERQVGSRRADPATRCHTVAPSTVGGCPRGPTAVENGRRAGRLLIEDLGSGNFYHERVADANGHRAARAAADTFVSGDRAHAAGSALCVSFRDSYRQ